MTTDHGRQGLTRTGGGDLRGKCVARVERPDDEDELGGVDRRRCDTEVGTKAALDVGSALGGEMALYALTVTV